MPDSEPEGAAGNEGPPQYTAGPVTWSPGTSVWVIGDTSRHAFQRGAENRTIFVAYPYILPRRDYRRPFEEVGQAFDVTFEFADEAITSRHILDKIGDMINRARFCLFDISLWNPNVTLELGIAIGQRIPYFLLFDPTKGSSDAPSDLRGFDRIQYSSYAELEDGLTRLLVQELGTPRSDSGKIVDQLDELRARTLETLRVKPGLKVGELADELATTVPVMQLVLRPLIGDGLETTGQRKGTRYYLAGQAPKKRT